MAETKKIMKEEYLFKEGDEPDHIYIIRSGLFAVTKTKNNAEVVLAEIGPGAMVGEMALFDKKPRSANVKALKESEVVLLPYDSLRGQLDKLPEWCRAVIRTLNENLRDANQRIKLLGKTEKDEERFPPSTINKLISIFNFVSHRFGKAEPEGWSVPPGTLRKFTIQIFQEPTNKMTAVLGALKDLQIIETIDLGEGKQKIINKKPDFLFNFIDWHNDWLFKPEKERVNLSADEIRILNGIIHFAKKEPDRPDGKKRINLDLIQNESMKEVGILIRHDDFKPFIEKALASEKIMASEGTFVDVIPSDLEMLGENFSVLNTLRRLLK